VLVEPGMRTPVQTYLGQQSTKREEKRHEVPVDLVCNFCIEAMHLKIGCLSGCIEHLGLPATLLTLGEWSE